MAVVMVIGAVLAAAVWQLAARQVEKDRQLSVPQMPQQNAPSRDSGSASATGDNSVANTGDGNTFNSTRQPAPKKPKGNQK